MTLVGDTQWRASRLAVADDDDMVNKLGDDVLEWLEAVPVAADPPPWTSMIEGRDHVSGDSFIMVGSPDDGAADLYVSRDSGPARAADLDAIAAARTYLPLLVAEIRRLRGAAR